jgi:hypothetical protein
MTLRLEEGSLVLEFDDGSRARRWDRHAAHVQGLGTHAPGTKAVDFCLWTDQGAAVVEVTNYGAKRIPAKAVAQEVAEKTRDTIASMLWACARGISTDRDYERFVQRFVDCGLGHKLEVVVWLDADKSPDPVEAMVVADEVRARLKPWLHARVTVTNRALQAAARGVPWLHASQTSRRS